jgi:hypothetical protein
VVIVTVFALSIVLAVVDIFFMFVFGSLGVLKNVRLLDLLKGTGDFT